jgi:hypothetical protein
VDGGAPVVHRGTREHRYPPSVVTVIAAGFAVSVVALRRAGSLLADLDPPRAPASAADPGWAASVALDSVVAAATGCLAGLDGGGCALGDAVCTAALAYERCDHDVADRIRAAVRDRYV